MKVNLKSVILFFPIYMFLTAFLTADVANASVEISQTGNGKILFKARDASLEEIVREFFTKYSIEINGLKSKERARISLSFEADTPEALLKGLLRHLGIKNFALEFANASLKRVLVVPGATADISTQPIPKTDQPEQKEFVNVAQIQSIIAASQAESLGLMEGDFITEYDGVLITNAQQFVEEVEKKASNNQVEMVIVRERIPRRLFLNGGFIGVRIITKKVPKEALNATESFE